MTHPRPTWRTLALALAVLVTACGPADPAIESAPIYVAQLEPLLYENGLIAQRVLLAAGEVHDATAEPAALHATWSTEIVPLSRHLADQAAVTAPPAEWAPQHEKLVGVWTTRAESYAGIDDAMTSGDRELWTTSRKQADEAKLEEEEWFRTMNERLAPAGLALDQFP